MPAILSLETSTDVCSVALSDGDTLLGEAVVHEPQAHASRLAPLIDQVIRDAGARFQDIRAVSVSSGPGSYTGLRIGTSTAKGLCYALDVPLIAVGTLELLAYQGKAFNAEGSFLCPMIDARRMEVYSLVTDAALNVIEPVAATIIDAGSFSELLETNRMLFFGNGVAKCREVIRHPNALFMDGIFPSATSLGELTQQKFAAGEFEDLAQFKPFYLKEFAAKKARTPM